MKNNTYLTSSGTNAMSSHVVMAPRKLLLPSRRLRQWSLCWRRWLRRSVFATLLATTPALRPPLSPKMPPLPLPRNEVICRYCAFWQRVRTLNQVVLPIQPLVPQDLPNSTVFEGGGNEWWPGQYQQAKFLSPKWRVGRFWSLPRQSGFEGGDWRDSSEPFSLMS